MRYIGAEISPHDAMPLTLIFLLKGRFHEVGHQFFRITLLEGLDGLTDRKVFHFLVHELLLDHRLAKTHFFKL